MASSIGWEYEHGRHWGVLDRIRASPVVGADEAGWRQHGVNGYVWTFNTLTDRYFVRGSRRKWMVDAVLGDGFAGVLVSDFDAAYDRYPGLKQRCCAHLLRETYDLKAQHPDDVELSRWAARVKDVYTKATAVRHRDLPPVHRAAVRVRGEPRVPPDSNGSERSLRHLVISQKVSAGHALCTRDREQDGLGLPVRHLAEPGASTPLIACRRMLPSPQLLLRHGAVQGKAVSRVVYY